MKGPFRRKPRVLTLGERLAAFRVESLPLARCKADVPDSDGGCLLLLGHKSAHMGAVGRK